MQDISNLTVFGVTPSFALALPVFAQDPKTSPGKPDGKTKNKGKNKPKALKGLSDFEKAAVERMKRFDPDVAKALGGTLPGKKTRKKRIQCVQDQIKSVRKKMKLIIEIFRGGFGNREKSVDALDKLGKAQKDLERIRKFYEKGVLPKWFIDQQKKAEKAKKEQKDKTTPTSKPAKQKPGANRNGLILLPETFLTGLAVINGDARV